MQYALMALFALLVTGADQLTKYLVLTRIPLGGSVPFLPGVMHLTYVQNDGGAFSSFSGQQWLFLLVFAVFTVFALGELVRKKLPFTAFERWCIVAIWAGGLGNMIDRLRFGYVVDMLATDFISFPVFNVADIFVTGGCILLLAHLLLWNREFWKDEKKCA